MLDFIEVDAACVLKTARMTKPTLKFLFLQLQISSCNSETYQVISKRNPLQADTPEDIWTVVKFKFLNKSSSEK